ncbi:MAG: GNAT family N-acetyltransferase [Chloroflexota bacterium]
MILITELEDHLAPQYPTESRHGYSVEKLLAQGVAFFVARYDGSPAGCGGVQLFGTEYGELKRMYVRPPYRGLGIARQVLARLEAYALEHNVAALRLETGIYQEAAIGLYERMGYRSIRPLASTGPIHSVCFTRNAFPDREQGKYPLCDQFD